MGKYRELIDGLMRDGKAVKGNYDALVHAGGRARTALTHALGKHDDDDVREMCAEILGIHGSVKVVPALIAALADASLCVRQDAFWSIEDLCGYRRGGLSDWLSADFDEPEALRRETMRWWAINRHYLEDNISFL